MEKHASAKKTVAGRVLAAFLAALMLIAALPATAFARTDGDEKDIVVSKIVEVITDDMNDGDGLNPAQDKKGRTYEEDNYYFEGDKIDYTDLQVTFEYYLKEDLDKKGEPKEDAEAKTKTFTFGDNNFEALFTVEPADGTALTKKDSEEPITVYVDKDKTVGNEEVYMCSEDVVLVERNIPKQSKLIKSFKTLEGDTEENVVIVIDGYALTHKKAADKVTIAGKKIPAPLKGAAVEVAGDELRGVTSDMLWTIDGTYDDETKVFTGKVYFTASNGDIYYLQLDGMDYIGDLYGGQAVASTLALVDEPTIHTDWNITLSAKQNRFDQLYMWVENTGAAEDDASGDADTQAADEEEEDPFKFILAYDKATGCFYGKYENSDPGRIVLPNIFIEEGDVAIYKVAECALKDFEVVKDPTKMVYTEGETFDPAGMQVKFIYTNGDSYIVDYEDFGKENVYLVDPYAYQMLTTSYNGKNVMVVSAELGKYSSTKGKLTVKTAGKVSYELANEIESGEQYVIVARVSADDEVGEYIYKDFNERALAPQPILIPVGPYLPGYYTLDGEQMDVYAGLAISSKKVNSFIAKYALDDADTTTLTARPVFWNNNKIISIPTNPFYTVSEDQIFTIVDNGSAKDGYSIISNDGKENGYLVRNQYEDKNVIMMTGISKTATDKDFYKWNIPGVNETVISGSNGTNNSDPYYMFVAADENEDDPSAGFNYEVGSVHKLGYDSLMKEVEDEEVEIYTDFVLFKVIRNVGDYKAIKVKDQPAKLSYIEGEALDLSGLSVEITYNDGSKEVVQYNDFASRSISVDLEQGKALALADNGKKATVSSGSLSDQTNAITVNSADDNTYAVPASFEDGNYVIVFANDAVVEDTILRTKVARALSSEVKTSARDDDTNETIKTVTAKDVKFDGEKVTSEVTPDMIWTVKKVTDKDGNVTYTIQSNDGKYLEYVSFDPAEFDPMTYVGIKLVDKLNDGDYAAALNGWKITGVRKADIYTDISEFEDELAEARQAAAPKLDYFPRIYATVGGYNGNYFAGTASDFGYLESMYLCKVNIPHTPIAFEIVTEPAAELLKGREGDVFSSYGDLEVKITYKDGTVENVKAADFAAKGITADVALNTVMTPALDKKPITLTFSGLKASTKTLFDITAVELTSTRLAGEDRIATAIEVAKAGWTESEFVILANSKNFPDALVGVPLAKAKEAPILLTPTEKLDQRVADEIKALKAKKVIILGETAAISQAVAEEVAALDVQVSRLGGATRYETAILIANEVNSAPSEIFLVSGKNESYPDALSISSVAAIKGVPVVYVGDDDTVKPSVVNYLSTKKSGISSTCIVGGPAAVSTAIQTKLAELGYAVERIEGADRYETSINVAKKYDAEGLFKSKDVAIATGTNYPDALSGGAFAAKKSIPVILVNDGTPNAAVKSFLAGRYADNLYVFGGTAVVSDATVNSLLGK